MKSTTASKQQEQSAQATTSKRGRKPSKSTTPTEETQATVSDASAATSKSSAGSESSTEVRYVWPSDIRVVDHTSGQVWNAQTMTQELAAHLVKIGKGNRIRLAKGAVEEVAPSPKK